MIVVVMGVCGCGKTSVGREISAATGWSFIEGDDLHPPSNRAKMAAGTPLDDDDRWPWLDAIAAAAHANEADGHSVVVACSALKRNYRKWLSGDLAPVVYVYMCGAEDVIRARLKAREHHFMLADMLDSQLRTLEPPVDALLVPVDLATEAQVARVLQALDIEV